jgi:hypothetical protein
MSPPCTRAITSGFNAPARPEPAGLARELGLAKAVGRATEVVRDVRDHGLRAITTAVRSRSRGAVLSEAFAEMLSGGICSLDPMISDGFRRNDRFVKRKRGTT